MYCEEMEDESLPVKILSEVEVHSERSDIFKYIASDSTPFLYDSVEVIKSAIKANGCKYICFKVGNDSDLKRVKYLISSGVLLIPAIKNGDVWNPCDIEIAEFSFKRGL